MFSKTSALATTVASERRARRRECRQVSKLFQSASFLSFFQLIRPPSQGSVPAHGAVRQRNPAGKPRSRNAAFLPRLRDERDRRPRIAGRARWAEAGAPAGPVRDARVENRSE